MSHTYTHLLFHIVFSTKQRRSLIGIELRPRLYQYLGGVVHGMNCVAVEIGGVADHVHLLVNIHPKYSISNFMRDLKTNTSKWINEADLVSSPFEWQRGYGAFTVSQSQVKRVQHYIQNQEVHHHQVTFEEEFITLLNAHRVEYNSHYIFDNLSPALRAL